MASRRARMRRHHRPHILLRVFLVMLAVTLLVTTAGVTVAAAMVQSWLKDLPEATAPKVAQATKIYAADGKLIARLYMENREVIPLQDMSPFLRQAVVAVEDERFYQHKGYDVPGIIRAAVKDVVAGSVEEGASTLTQQYVRQTLLQKEATQIKVSRKIREIYLAQQIEERYSKDEILAMYLNTVYFGDGAYGAEAAAKHYFNKAARNLTIAEAAMLAGIPQSPKWLNPFGKGNLKRATARQHWVLAKMLDQGYITAEQYEQARAEKLKFESGPEALDGIYDCEYFVAHVKKQLQEMYGTQAVFKGGLKVYTTVEPAMQAEAERARDRNLNERGDPSAAIVAIDPKTGYIKAMVGGKDYAKNKFNLATQGKRQPGSSFKMFTLATALEKGVPPYRAFNSDSPVVIQGRKGAPDWTVYNSEGHGRGWISLEQASFDSVNTVFARLIDELGAGQVATMAKRMGITSRLPNYPSITLGTANVTPLEMASAYGTLAANGVHYKPTGIMKVVGPDGKVLYGGKPVGRQAVSREVAYATTKVLEHVISEGTGTRADIDRPAAGKTGTSQNYRDAWFVGYTPDLVTAVWVGHTTERPMTNVHGGRGFGGTLAAPIWRDFMGKVLRGKPKTDFKHADDPDYKWKDGWSRPHRDEPKKEEDTQLKPGDGKKTKPPTTPTKPQPKPDPPPPSTPTT